MTVVTHGLCGVFQTERLAARPTEFEFVVEHAFGNGRILSFRHAFLV
jgi:hypothetical protein